MTRFPFTTADDLRYHLRIRRWIATRFPFFC